MGDATQVLPGKAHAQTVARPTRWGVFSNEDWWSVWIGLLVIAVAWALFANGGSLKWLAVAPAKWKTLTDAWQGVATHWPNYLALFAAFALLFGTGLAVAFAVALPAFVPHPVRGVAADLHGIGVDGSFPLQP